MADFEIAIRSLKSVAGSLKLCDNSRLKELGYRRINFHSHRYFMLYRIVENTVFVDHIFHELQDYENKDLIFLPLLNALKRRLILRSSIPSWMAEPDIWRTSGQLSYKHLCFQEEPVPGYHSLGQW